MESSARWSRPIPDGKSVLASGRRTALRRRSVSLQRHRPAGHTSQRAVADGEVVPDQVQLGVSSAWEEDLLRIGDGHLPAGNLQDLLALRHAETITGWELLAWSLRRLCRVRHMVSSVRLAPALTGLMFLAACTSGSPVQTVPSETGATSSPAPATPSRAEPFVRSCEASVYGDLGSGWRKHALAAGPIAFLGLGTAAGATAADLAPAEGKYR